MLRVDVSKNSSTALSSHDGAFVTSTTTSAPVSALASPWPVMVLTPDEGDADTASWPRPLRIGISFLPMSPLPPITTIFMLDLLECRPDIGGATRFPPPSSGPRALARGSRSLLLFLLLGDDEVLGIFRVQDGGDEARLVLLAGVPADTVQAAGRLIEGVTGLKYLGLVVVDGPLVLALQDVPERRAGMAVRRLHLARRQRHLEHRGLGLLPVQLLDDVLLGERLHASFAVFAMLGQGHPADGESTEDNRQQGASHDSSSDRNQGVFLTRQQGRLVGEFSRPRSTSEDRPCRSVAPRPPRGPPCPTPP